MTRDEIYDLAGQVWGAGEVYIGPGIENLMHFAELVVNAEQKREWVYLTGDEIGVPSEPLQPYEAVLFARLIEASIKRKNYGPN